MASRASGVFWKSKVLWAARPAELAEDRSDQAAFAGTDPDRSCPDASIRRTAPNWRCRSWLERSGIREPSGHGQDRRDPAAQDHRRPKRFPKGTYLIRCEGEDRAEADCRQVTVHGPGRVGAGGKDPQQHAKDEPAQRQRGEYDGEFIAMSVPLEPPSAVPVPRLSGFALPDSSAPSRFPSGPLEQGPPGPLPARVGLAPVPCAGPAVPGWPLASASPGAGRIGPSLPASAAASSVYVIGLIRLVPGSRARV